MQILLVSSTSFEIQPQFAAGIDILISGVGVPSTLYHLQKRLHQLDYDLVIQAGIAGTFEKGPELEETVLVERDCFGDLGTEQNEEFCNLFDAGLADKNEFPFSDGWLINKNEMLDQLPYRKVRSITVNKVSDDLLMKRQCVHCYAPGIESMEGAALHYVCLQEDVPFLQIRTVSNHVGERNKKKWKLEPAIANLNQELTKVIEYITKEKK